MFSVFQKPCITNFNLVANMTLKNEEISSKNLFKVDELKQFSKLLNAMSPEPLNEIKFSRKKS